MKAATIALIVRNPDGKVPEVVDILSDEREISLLEGQVDSGEGDPLQKVYEMRATQAREDDEFADYVEDLLSQPFVNSEIQEHGVQWLKSKIRIEQHRKSEADAAKVIAQYALRVFTGDPQHQDFLLAGPRVSVRVRVFVLNAGSLTKAA